ncbi:NAD(P)H-dependent oxidoreductase [Pseudonocardia sp. KRD-184]|uniref:FMN dependent NADH:quinone oxidoreductase n=1 Tax=Pseudonocardia oceani TaxID=2792013 RepID=A0ABS6UE42_9PSEU|nr:NAD(P)H-dependent oxidoreductase [Pseudonocardia oceani]MBW0092334.1 NAD(P)H-dependent oxidoreductase [Pseudonocardia oceani]MBW0097619.1 NAD(P)H-dependent oxidoreductase [Pseudonocardia oceani]MBW0107668.1 NAD(P)H-dependent oxidoreductase [Pseudonocardia oceani]MBW0123157.1 NAD(P)H-dependent oxidoreductase [Pseudonocardia oceani]MBW0130525.1 NAD(P)H-dependent oxidoreductase [Pseudonocardia oceani]
MSMFRLDSSIRTEGSVSRGVADTLEGAYLEQHPNATVERRDLVADPLPDVWPVAAFAGFTPEDQRSDEQRAALDLTRRLADEVLGADVVVIATPLYNFGVPAHLKAWIDLLITDPRFGPGTSPLAGRPVTLVIARGGGYGAGTPREGWDHATPYLVRILADVWGADLTLVEAELTLAPVTPAMAELVPLAEASQAQAHERASEVGKALAARTAA